jgi:dihydrofolate reductase
MSRFSGSQDFQVPRQIVQKGFVNVETITANKTILNGDSTYQILTNNTSALDCIINPLKDGLMYVITNKGNQNIVIKDAAANTIATIGNNQSGIFVCDGSNWHAVLG